MSAYFEQTVRPHARLAILKLLESAPQYTSNVSMMSGLVNQMGITMTRAQLVTEVEWLQSQGLVKIDKPIGDHLIVVTATIPGVEIAQGIGRHDGIQRPRPGS